MCLEVHLCEEFSSQAFISAWGTSHNPGWCVKAVKDRLICSAMCFKVCLFALWFEGQFTSVLLQEANYKNNNGSRCSDTHHDTHLLTKSVFYYRLISFHQWLGMQYCIFSSSINQSQLLEDSATTSNHTS